MKKGLILATLFILGTLNTLYAQPQMGGLQNLIVKYGEELNLTEAQKTELIQKSMQLREEMPQRENRFSRRQEGMRNNPQGMQFQPRQMSDLIYQVLTEDQIETWKELRVTEIEKEHDFRALQNRIRVEMAGISADKSEQVLAILNRQNDFREANQISRVENPENWSPETRTAHMEAMMNWNEELKSLLTVDEYQKLMGSGMQGRAARGRMNRS